MEKFSQFRDRGSGISPFMPITTPASALSSIVHVFIFLFRLPFFVSYVLLYFLVLHHLPLPVFVRKLLLWGVMGIPGIWWVDLQLDGVKRGRLSQQPPSRVPHPRSVIAANFTSPIDALYLAAIFDPVFTVSYPGTRKVRRIGLLQAVCMALSNPPRTTPPPPPPPTTGLTDLRALLERYPDRVIAVFPECGTTNGKGILPLSPSLLAVPSDVAIFPVSMRYTPPDITTPVPGAWFAFLWKLLSRPTHCIRVRIAERMHNTSLATNGVSHHDTKVVGEGAEGGSEATPEEQRVLDRVAEALARLGRNKRVGLTMKDKAAFVEAWNKRRR
ncbi:putative acyltransferase [Diplogelasinospora grovesii]|uniref:Acyltransferase n=1 Tax=Diplogelasinospora grovesii TaxID=303347 RepID=A0AAN6S5Q2_9PEZI|nr:putative acyltransferase [Diplogelasinospora grovesii]